MSRRGNMTASQYLSTPSEGKVNSKRDTKIFKKLEKRKGEIREILSDARISDNREIYSLRKDLSNRLGLGSIYNIKIQDLQDFLLKNFYFKTYINPEIHYDPVAGKFLE